MKDLKYLLAYTVPLLVFLSMWLAGAWSFLAIAVLFGLVPLLEMGLRGSTANPGPEEENLLRRKRLFDLLLYLNVPIHFALLGYFLYSFSYRQLAPYEMLGFILSMGISCGSLGINVAHELGHRSKRYEQWMAQLLLLGSLYMHFFIEHNRGHHKNVATPLDPASAPKHQHLYAFWWQSITGGYRSAWQLERQRLARQGKAFFSLHNLMLQYHVLQGGLLLLIAGVFGWQAMLAFVAASLVGILQLETVNYLEHYGLRRKELRPGVYERVLPSHSWNTNRSIGRILLYELTRHSDHHYKASRKYQVLRHFDESPQLPSGYPGMMILSLIPPLWYRVMHKALQKWEQ
ncbi:MAG: alkane 1-monooxygenase [Bacteroidetes bacterium]|nr:MAG: alkane 1-monooxygenase [Bacteroidota bacterium]